jgi:PAS domain S-box-containing protein
MDASENAPPRAAWPAVGLVTVAPGSEHATVNAAAGALLNLGPGTHSVAAVTAALEAMADRAVNREEIAAAQAAAGADPHAESSCLWRFSEPPTHLLVVSSPVRSEDSGGRVWVFHDESASVSASHPDRYLRASFDAEVDPHMLIEAVRDAGGQIVDFVYRDVNRAMCKNLAASRKDLIGRRLRETLPGFVESGLLARYAECAERGTPVVVDDYDYTVIHRGLARQCDIRAARAEGDLLTVTWRDVTDRFDALQRITHSEAQFRLLAQNIGEVVVRIKDDDTIAWISASVQQVLGLPAQSYVGRSVREFLAADEPPDRWRAARDGEAIVGRARLVQPDAEHWVHFFLKPFYDADGARDGLVVTFRVIDNEVEMERRVEEARRMQGDADARWHRMFDNAAVGMCVADLSGRLEVTNQAMCDFIGYDAEALRGLTWAELTEPGFLDSDRAAVQSLVRGKIESYRTAKPFNHAGGRVVWGDLSVSCLRAADGQPEGFIAQIIDITSEVEARRTLTRRDEQNRLLTKQLQEKSDRLTSELRSAAEYVASILPDGLDGAVQVGSRYLPSQAVAGDCFDYRWIDDDHLFVYLLDVSGHGIQSALLSVSVHNLLRSGSLPESILRQPDRVIAELNDLFAMDDHAGNYFTIWCGVYQRPTRTLTYCTGGHPPALLLSAAPAAAAVTPLYSAGVPVGMFDDSEYASVTVSIAQGDSLLLYSDGAFEIPMPDGRAWLVGDFIQVIGELGATPGWTLDTLVDALRSRTVDGAFEDDLTLVRLTFVD